MGVRGLKFTVKGACDIIDIRDAAHGFILAASKGRRGDTYILSGERLTVRDVAQMVWQETHGRQANLEVPLWLAYWVAGLMPFYAELTGSEPIFMRYSLDAICSKSHFSHAKASPELGFQPRPACQAVLDAVQWLRQGLRPVSPTLKVCPKRPSEKRLVFRGYNRPRRKTYAIRY